MPLWKRFLFIVLFCGIGLGSLAAWIQYYNPSNELMAWIFFGGLAIAGLLWTRWRWFPSFIGDIDDGDIE